MMRSRLRTNGRIVVLCQSIELAFLHSLTSNYKPRVAAQRTLSLSPSKAYLDKKVLDERMVLVRVFQLRDVSIGYFDGLAHVLTQNDHVDEYVRVVVVLVERLL